MMTLKYLNIGCGNKFHRDWINVDMVSRDPAVRACNILKGLPFADDSMEVIYHSQVLEHIPKANAESFVRECARVLKPGGIMRVVVPDLENIVDEYRKALTQNLTSPTTESEAEYDWIMLEMYDQAVRYYHGGEMARYLCRDTLPGEKYVLDRIGFVGRELRKKSHERMQASNRTRSLKQVAKNVLESAYNLFTSQAYRVGRFRTGGEVHLWMFDRYSLARLLKRCGLGEAEVASPTESRIADWSRFELDARNGEVYDPTSLFMECCKVAR